MQVWIVEYIFDDGGKAGIRTAKISAPDYETARSFALGDAPASDFVMSLRPESEDQFLGRPAIRARQMTGQVTREVPDPDDDIDPDDADHD